MLRTLRIIFFLVAVLVSLASSPVSGEEPYSYATLWRSWGTLCRDAYVDGVVDGSFNAYMAAAEVWLGPGQLHSTPESEKVRRVREQVFVRDQRPQIPAVMTELYSDPANVYVVLIDMVFISRDKLEGKNVETALQDARKRALTQHRLNQQMKR